jgi:hypothetical protein
MSSITTITFFRFPKLVSKIWAFGQMQFAHSSIRETSGLRFYKLMGSGREPGFSPLPDWGVYTLLAVWENEKDAHHFFKYSKNYANYQKWSSEQWTIFMKPISTKGLWSGKNPFTAASDLDASNPLIAVITRATIRTNKLIKFWSYVPSSQKPIQRGCEGLLFTKGVGEVPLVQMATFSLWQNIESLKKFAYNSPEHQQAIKKTHQFNWYKEEMFVRFQPFLSIGNWAGEDLLSSYLKK